MKKSQIFNPYLPSYEYVPDGEPHVFGDRVFLYGSHDRFDGAVFCLNDYVCYSADVEDLTQWRYEGVIYRKEQDPRNQNIKAEGQEAKPGFCAKPDWTDKDLNKPGVHAMWAPDVVEGLDNKYYLYYCLDYLPEIGVAVSDSPAGPFEYLGLVRHKDQKILGRKEGDLVQFDPGIFIDEQGDIFLYSGNAPIRKDQDDGRKGSQVMKLESDMLTLKEEPKRLLPSVTESQGSGFEGHEFFEASSIRKVNGMYYLVYSSVNSHELCYAFSKYPDKDYQYGGTIIDIGDVYLKGRRKEDAVNCLGNTHGGIEYINHQWYVFYHRQTNRTNYSRQACAEPIFFEEDGTIPQVEVTSMGLNKAPLIAYGTYPAYICCYLRGIKGVTYSHPIAMGEDYPYLTQDVEDISPLDFEQTLEKSPIQYVKNIRNQTIIGYKYFSFMETKEISFRLRGKGKGKMWVMTSPDEKAERSIPIDCNHEDWVEFKGQVQSIKGVYPLFLSMKAMEC